MILYNLRANAHKCIRVKTVMCGVGKKKRERAKKVAEDKKLYAVRVHNSNGRETGTGGGGKANFVEQGSHNRIVSVHI